MNDDKAKDIAVETGEQPVDPAPTGSDPGNMPEPDAQHVAIAPHGQGDVADDAG